jgi:hypothetical protein
MSVKRQKTDGMSEDINKIIDTDVSSIFQNVDILRAIVSFVGMNQYRFVATINKDFMATYLKLFPNNKETYINGSTVNHATICVVEWNHFTPSFFGFV